MSIRVGLRHISRTLARLRLCLPAWNYDNLIGTIWLEGNPAGYDTSHTGQIAVREPQGVDVLGQIQGGTYDNRA